MRRLLPFAALGLALLPPGAAAAQSNVRPIDETAADLAYGLCPLYLAGQLELTSSEVSERGFGPKIETVQNARFGEMRLVYAKLADGEIGFGGAPQKTCSVIVFGPKREDALAALHTNMAYMGFDFAVDPTNTGDRNGAQLETFKAKLDDTNFFYVQLIQSATPAPMVTAQLFVMDQ
ncbi:MAG: hypothetical protein WDN24_09175 [Sphingomonas sp.]